MVLVLMLGPMFLPSAAVGWLAAAVVLCVAILRCQIHRRP